MIIFCNLVYSRKKAMIEDKDMEEEENRELKVVVEDVILQGFSFQNYFEEQNIFEVLRHDE